MALGLGKVAVPPPVDARGSEREEVRVPATMIGPDGGSESVLVDNLSATGFRALAAAEMTVGSEFRISLIGGRARRARVVWREGRCAGCEFLPPGADADRGE